MFKEFYAMGKVICKYSNMREDYIQREQNCFPNCAFHLNKYNNNNNMYNRYNEYDIMN